jgi:hypothetical protein
MKRQCPPPQNITKSRTAHFRLCSSHRQNKLDGTVLANYQNAQRYSDSEMCGSSVVELAQGEAIETSGRNFLF